MIDTRQAPKAPSSRLSDPPLRTEPDPDVQPYPAPGYAWYVVAVLMVVYVFGYAMLFETLGFIIATAIVTVLIGRLFGGSWGKMIIGGIVMGVLFFLLFDRALDVVLPLGPLEFLS